MSKPKIDVSDCPVHGKKGCQCTMEYKLWSRIMSLPSYGLVAGDTDNPMLARKDVIKALEGK